MRGWVSAGSAARRIRSGDDRGQGSLEYIGAIVVVGLIVAVVVAAVAMQNGRVAHNFAYAVCKLVTIGQGDCGSPAAALGKDRTPTEPCVVSSNSVSMNREIGVLIVTAKDGRQFEVAQLSDGRYRVTKLDGAGAGVETGVGAGLSVTVNDQRYGAYADASVGAGLEFRSGEVYYADDMGELRRLVSEEQEDTVEDTVFGDTPGRWLWERGQDLVGKITGNGDYEFPEPDETYAEGGVALNASAEATSLIMPNSLKAEGMFSETLGTRTTKDGRTTVYLRTTVSGAAEAQMLGAGSGGTGLGFQGAGLEGKIQMVTGVTFDSNGNMVEVKTTSTAAGQSKGATNALFGGDFDTRLSQSQSSVGVYEATLPIANAQDRNTALSFLAAAGVSQLGGINLTTLPLTVGATGNFIQAAADHGTLTQQDMTYNSNTAFGVEAAGKFEVELAAKIDVSTMQLTSTGAKYWDGAAWQTWAGCAA